MYDFKYIFKVMYEILKITVLQGVSQDVRFRINIQLL
jgi:hypothetical protein